jgi:predicted phosphoadenosine phosphosulfate sulfurtransferase
MVYKKGHIDKTVVQATEDRYHRLYDDFDRVVISFSGGKDSSVALHMAIRVAKQRGELPVEVVHYDEEIVPYDTVDYVRRQHDRDEVDMRWLCWPMKFVNGVNLHTPNWTAWNEEQRANWVREKPECAEKTPPRGWSSEKHAESNDVLFSGRGGSIALVLGTRAQESLARYRSVSHSLEDNWISNDTTAKFVKRCKPVYDWTYEDIWKATNEFGWDYNLTYDRLTLAGVSSHNQRVSQPFNDTSIRGLWQYRKLYPDLWDGMLERLPGSNTALKYNHTNLYGSNLGLLNGGEDEYKTAIRNVLEEFNETERAEIVKKIEAQIQRHYQKTDDAIPLQDRHGKTQISWQVLLKIAIQGDRRDSITGNI